MTALQVIWSNGMVFAVWSSAALSFLLVAVCLAGSLCPSDPTAKLDEEPAGLPDPTAHMDLAWLRSA